jgi:hypothetical protein
MDTKWMILIVLNMWWFKILIYQIFDIVFIIDIDEDQTIKLQ